MLPRSSIVTSRLTSTRLRASWRDPLARLTVTMAGSSCGVMPIAIASENSSASISGREKRDVDDEDRDGEHGGDLHEQPREVAQPDLERRLGLPLREPGRDAAPNAVAVPVATTTPRPEPWCTIVPMNAHEGRSSGESLAGATAVAFGDRHRLAGQHGLVALEVRHVEQPQVGGHDVADAKRDDVAGHEVGDVDARSARRRARPPPRGGGRVQRGHGVRRAVLVEEAQAHAEHDDRGDDRGVRGVAGQARDDRRGKQQHQERVAHLAQQHRERRDPVHGQRVRPELT